MNVFNNFLKTFSQPVQWQVLVAEEEEEKEEEQEEEEEEEEGVSDRYVRSFK